MAAYRETYIRATMAAVFDYGPKWDRVAQALGVDAFDATHANPNEGLAGPLRRSTRHQMPLEVSSLLWTGLATGAAPPNVTIGDILQRLARMLGCSVTEQAESFFQYFFPGAGTRAGSSGRGWADDRILLFTPSPLKDGASLDLEGGEYPEAPLDRLQRVALYTLRLSMRWKEPQIFQPTGASSSDADADADGIHSAVFQRLLRLRVRPFDCRLPSILGLATEFGMPLSRIRTNLTWIGGKSPLDAWLVPTDASNIAPLLEEMNSYITSRPSVETRGLADALAYQFIHIHPLNDGNGRLSRILLIWLSLRLRQYFPLFVAWRILLAYKMQNTAWEKARRNMKNELSAMCLYDEWLRCAEAILSRYDELQAKGVSEHVISALCAYGYFSEKVLALYANCSASLARKIVCSHSPMFSVRGERFYDGKLIELERKAESIFA